MLSKNLPTRHKAGCIVKIDQYDLIVKTKKGFIKLKEFSTWVEVFCQHILLKYII